MFNADTLLFREFVMAEPIPLATIQEAVFHFLKERDDVVIFGVQAVNAYVKEPRMTQNIDLISTHAKALSEELRRYLHDQFHVAIRVRTVAKGRGFRLIQIQKTGYRHLIDIRMAETLPASQRMAEVLVMLPSELVASKVISYYQRRGKPKAGTDWRDIALLLLVFPELKTEEGEVLARLKASEVDFAVLNVWHEIVHQELLTEDEDDKFL